MNIRPLKAEYTKQLNAQALGKRQDNINYFSQLNRDGLAYRQRERKLLLYTTRSNEKIYIQYPGKESVSDIPDKVRPWDFRPKLLLADGTQIPDLSFKNIWDDLQEIRNADGETLSALAAIFFRMAYMIDYNIETGECPFEDVCNIEGEQIVSQGTLQFSWWKPCFSLDLLAEIQEVTGLLQGASIEAYLVYNDLLVQNEDCKYYYRDTVVEHRRWKDKIGRHNTLLTHVSVISFLLGKITFSQIMDQFQRGRGVAPASIRSLSTITDGIIQ